MTLAECRGVTVRYGRGEAAVEALAEIEFAIEQGDAVALLGRSGSGKTTLLHVLGGLVEPTAGSVRWQGGELSSLDGDLDRWRPLIERTRLGPGTRHRLRLPGSQSAAALHRLRERRLRRPRLGGRCRGVPGAAGAARGRRPGRKGRQPPGRALGRRSPAGRDRPCPRPVAPPAALRRAHGPPRLGHGRTGARPDRSAPARVRVRARRGHARRRRGGALSEAGRAARRPGGARGGARMRAAWTLAVAGLARAPARTLARIVVLAGAVALLAAMIVFVGHSLRRRASPCRRSGVPARPRVGHRGAGPGLRGPRLPGPLRGRAPPGGRPVASRASRVS